MGEQLVSILRYSKSKDMVKNHHKFGKPNVFVCNRSNCDLNMKDYFEKHKPQLEEVLEKTVLIIEQPLFEQPDNGLTVDDNYLEDNILKNSIDVVDNPMFLEKIVAIIIMVITIGGLLGKHFFIAHFISENAVLNEYICEDEKPISKKLKNGLRKQKQKQKEQELHKQQQTTTEEQEEQEELEEKKKILDQNFPNFGNQNQPKTNQHHPVGNWKEKLFCDKNEAATPNAPIECAVKAEKSSEFAYSGENPVLTSWADLSDDLTQEGNNSLSENPALTSWADLSD